MAKSILFKSPFFYWIMRPNVLSQRNNYNTLRFIKIVSEQKFDFSIFCYVSLYVLGLWSFIEVAIKHSFGTVPLFLCLYGLYL